MKLDIPMKVGGRPTKRPSAEVLCEMYKVHTAKEIAEEYGVAISTVRSWICRLRKETE